MDQNDYLQIGTLGVTLITGLLLPVAVGLITQVDAHPTVKFIVNAVLSTIGGVVAVSTTADGTAIISNTTAVAAGITLAISVASYLGLYRPVDLNRRTLPNAGIGGTATKEN